MKTESAYDVLVVGGGNAALCAAISARRGGASVLLLEVAPRGLRGGNSRHTRNLRCMHAQPTDVLTDAYSFSEYWDDLLQVTGGETNETLARITLEGSATCCEWMIAQGVRFQPALAGTLHLSRTNAFFLGGGKALLNAYYRRAEGMGVDIEYETEVRGLDIRDGRFRSATVRGDGISRQVLAGAFVAASGGFQGNLDWLKEVWGEGAGQLHNSGDEVQHRDGPA